MSDRELLEEAGRALHKIAVEAEEYVDSERSEQAHADLMEAIAAAVPLLPFLPGGVVR